MLRPLTTYCTSRRLLDGHVDLTINADLVEEVARMEGYDGIEAVEPSIPAHAIPSAQYDCEEQIATALEALRDHEIVTYALQGTTTLNKVARSGLQVSRKIFVDVLNPLTEEQRVLRWSYRVPALRISRQTRSAVPRL